MPCFVPFDGKKLDVSFFGFRHVGVFADELIDALKLFSFYTEDLGCIYSSIFKSIHGNMVVWYGAWIKRPDAERKKLLDHVISALSNVSHLAVLLDYGFFQPYAGESKDGHPLAKFLTGDIISMTAMAPVSDAVLPDLSYASLALLKSYYLQREGVSAGACFRCLDKPMVATLQLWTSLHACYAWLIYADYRRSVVPYLSHLSDDAQLYEVFKVMYVSTDELLGMGFLPPLKMIEHGVVHGYGEHQEEEQQEENASSSHVV